jgi:multidrug resistance efflux pump
MYCWLPPQYSIKLAHYVHSLNATKLMQLNLNSRFFRRLVGVVILLAVVIIVVPALFKVQTGNAIINARTVLINSPIDGVVAEVYQPVGTAIPIGQPLLSIRNPRLNEGFFNELLVEQRSLLERLAGMQRQKKQLQALQANLQARRDAHAFHEAKRIEHQIAESEAQALSQQGSIDELTLAAQRSEKLVKERFISAVEFERSQYALESAKQQLSAINARVRALQTEAQALGQGVYLGEGRNDVPYTQQRLDDLAIQMIELETRIAETDGREQDIRTQMASEAGRLSMNREVTIPSPVQGLVWRKYVAQGSDVVVGTRLVEMVNCDRLFLEVAIADSELTNLSVGSMVSYRLLGSHQWRDGEVFQVSGSGDRNIDSTLAARLETDAKQGRILVHMSSNALPDPMNNHCYVGRRAEVTVDRSWNMGVALTRLTNLFR